jgi:hypothetical protein
VLPPAPDEDALHDALHDAMQTQPIDRLDERQVETGRDVEPTVDLAGHAGTADEVGDLQRGVLVGEHHAVLGFDTYQLPL